MFMKAFDNINIAELIILLNTSIKSRKYKEIKVSIVKIDKEIGVI